MSWEPDGEAEGERGDFFSFSRAPTILKRVQGGRSAVGADAGEYLRSHTLGNKGGGSEDARAGVSGTGERGRDRAGLEQRGNLSPHPVLVEDEEEGEDEGEGKASGEEEQSEEVEDEEEAAGLDGYGDEDDVHNEYSRALSVAARHARQLEHRSGEEEEWRGQHSEVSGSWRPGHGQEEEQEAEEEEDEGEEQEEAEETEELREDFGRSMTLGSKPRFQTTGSKAGGNGATSAYDRSAHVVPTQRSLSSTRSPPPDVAAAPYVKQKTSVDQAYLRDAAAADNWWGNGRASWQNGSAASHLPPALPPMPGPGAPQVVECQKCGQLLEVPPSLPPPKKGIQKLRCGKCLRVSRFQASTHTAGPPRQGPNQEMGRSNRELRQGVDVPLEVGYVGEGGGTAHHSFMMQQEEQYAYAPDLEQHSEEPLESEQEQQEAYQYYEYEQVVGEEHGAPVPAPMPRGLPQREVYYQEEQQYHQEEQQYHQDEHQYHQEEQQYDQEEQQYDQEEQQYHQEEHQYQQSEGIAKQATATHALAPLMVEQGMAAYEAGPGSRPTFSRRVVINGNPVPDDVLEAAETRAGIIHPGTYWYDAIAGFWGEMGGPCLGIIPPALELGPPLIRSCAGGNTSILVNGRELHLKDLDRLRKRGLPTEPNCSYRVDINGNVYDWDTGEFLLSLGKLAPSLETRKRGGGMKTSDVSYR